MMSEKCKHCKENIFDNNGQDHGIYLSDGSWCCYQPECMEKQIEYSDRKTAELEAVKRERDELREAALRWKQAVDDNSIEWTDEGVNKIRNSALEIIAVLKRGQK